jgi:predicted methyltransferase
MKSILALAILALAVACGSPQKAPEQVTAAPPPPALKPLPETLDAAINSDFRTAVNRERDRYRHPLETLNFFGIQPTMTVVEIAPSSGWYTEILAPYLAKSGHYIGAVTHSNSAESDTGWQKLNSWVGSNPPMSSTVTFTEFSPTDKVDIAPAGSVDMVVTFRNVHNWMHKHSEAAAFSAFFKALKRKGILGVVEHRAAAKGKDNPESGYVSQKRVISLAKKAGFKLVAKSEINANPADTKDYPEGVWTLPPNFKLGEKDHAKYAAIGESDRMTLKFVKP